MKKKERKKKKWKISLLRINFSFFIEKRFSSNSTSTKKKKEEKNEKNERKSLTLDQTWFFYSQFKNISVFFFCVCYMYDLEYIFYGNVHWKFNSNDSNL